MPLYFRFPSFIESVITFHQIDSLQFRMNVKIRTLVELTKHNLNAILPLEMKEVVYFG